MSIREAVGCGQTGNGEARIRDPDAGLPNSRGGGGRGRGAQPLPTILSGAHGVVPRVVPGHPKIGNLVARLEQLLA